MHIIRIYIVLIAILALFDSCKQNTKKLPDHQVRFFNGSTNNKIEVLDWGGDGAPLFFLSGLGNSAHVFDDFAPKFTDAFHVYALTRRGFGASAPSNGYDLKTLTSDIIAIMDSLHIQKVILAGHSIAGEEITKFAVLYPDRIDKIIYFDAAYDRIGIDSLFSDSPESPKATSDDSSSIQKLKKFYISTYGITMTDEEIKQTSVFSKEGRYLRDLTADSIIGAVIAGAEHPDYTHIKCPALAIYAQNDSVQEIFKFYSGLDSTNKSKADKIHLKGENLRLEQQNRFKNEVQNGIVKVIKGADHYLFITHPYETEKMMREFLK